MLENEFYDYYKYVCVYIYLSVSLSLSLSIYLSIHLSLYIVLIVNISGIPFFLRFWLFVHCVVKYFWKIASQLSSCFVLD